MRHRFQGDLQACVRLLLPAWHEPGAGSLRSRRRLRARVAEGRAVAADRAAGSACAGQTGAALAGRPDQSGAGSRRTADSGMSGPTNIPWRDRIRPTDFGLFAADAREPTDPFLAAKPKLSQIPFQPWARALFD